MRNSIGSLIKKYWRWRVPRWSWRRRWLWVFQPRIQWVQERHHCSQISEKLSYLWKRVSNSIAETKIDTDGRMVRALVAHGQWVRGRQISRQWGRWEEDSKSAEKCWEEGWSSHVEEKKKEQFQANWKPGSIFKFSASSIGILCLLRPRGYPVRTTDQCWDPVSGVTNIGT